MYIYIRKLFATVILHKLHYLSPTVEEQLDGSVRAQYRCSPSYNEVETARSCRKTAE